MDGKKYIEIHAVCFIGALVALVHFYINWPNWLLLLLLAIVHILIFYLCQTAKTTFSLLLKKLKVKAN